MKIVRPVIICAVLAAGAYAAWHYTRPAKQTEQPVAAVPVSVATSRQDSVPIYLTAIGNVRALNSIDIHPQVGGVLINVAVKEGDMVQKGQVLAVIDPRPFKAALDKAQAQLTQDQAQLQNAQTDQQRYTQLAKSDFASRQQVDTQTSTVNRYQGVVAADQASIEEAKINLGYSIVKAPIAGKVGLRRVDPGNVVQAGGATTIFSVVQEQPISVIYSLAETDLPTVRDAMKIGELVTLADTPGGMRVLDRGVLATTDNSVNSESGTIQLRSVFPNADMLLTPGQFVNIRLQVGVSSGVTIPHVAVQHGQDGLFVFEVDANKTTKRQNVKVAYDDGKQAVLLDGLASGAVVVTAGQSRIGEGTKVSAKDMVADASPRSAAP
ncbi:MAG: efflux RND transporter periplasmic adaptor subunit [Janthinobacterium lividum]